MCCPSCRAPLEQHQPDRRWPERLLGVCPECGTWCLIDSRAGAIARLPGVQELRDAAPTTREE